MRPRAANRLSGFGTSIFTEMSRLAVEHRAVNLGQGFPDFPAPDFVKQAAVRAIAADHNQYAPSPGLPRLRAAIATNWKRLHGADIDPDHEVTVLQGATEALCAVALALLDPGDEAILFEPFYDAYVPDVQMAGAVPRFVRLHRPDWSFRIEELAAAFSPRTRLLFLNTPHNPTGKVFTLDELDAIARLCIQHDVIAVSDEVYSALVYPGARHVPIATRPGMRDRTVTIDSIGKVFGVTGWKIGWTIASAPLTEAIRGAHQFVTFCNSTPFQHAAADALTEAPMNGYYTDLVDTYQRRRQLLTQVLTEAKLAPLPIAGSYFLLSDLAHLPFDSDVAFCRHLLTEVGVAALPPSAFYAEPRTAPRLARFCFAKTDQAMHEAGKRLARRPLLDRT